MDTSPFPFLFSLFLKYFWLIAIAFTFINLPIMKARADKYIQEDPSLEDGYNSLLRGFMVYTNLPWVAMGMGMIFGDFDTVFDILFGLRSGNPFVWLFYATVIGLWILLFAWVYFWGGAEMLANHPGFTSHLKQSPTAVKIKIALSAAGGIDVLYAISNMNW